MKNIFDTYGEILHKEFIPGYIEVALQHVREWSVDLDCREDIKQFLANTEDLPGTAVVALTCDQITLLTDSDGQLLAFA